MAGVGLSLLTAAVVSVTASLSAGRPLTLSLVLGAVLTAARASGLWSWTEGEGLALPGAQARVLNLNNA